MDRNTSRFTREKKTLKAMIGIYCREHHRGGEELCADCSALIAYALGRLDKCPFGERKPKCSACTIHCYKPDFRDRIRAVMSFAGPRMLKEHPVLAVGHLVDGLRHRPAARQRRRVREAG